MGYCIFQKTYQKIDLIKAAAVYAEVLNISLIDARSKANLNSAGQLLDGLDLDQATRVQSALQEVSYETEFSIKEVELRKPQNVFKASFLAAGITYADMHGNLTEQDWASLKAVSVYVDMKSASSYEKKQSLALMFRDGTNLRINSHSFNYEYLGGRTSPNRLENFKSLLLDIEQGTSGLDCRFNHDFKAIKHMCYISIHENEKSWNLEAEWLFYKESSELMFADDLMVLTGGMKKVSLKDFNNSFEPETGSYDAVAKSVTLHEEKLKEQAAKDLILREQAERQRKQKEEARVLAEQREKENASFAEDGYESSSYDSDGYDVNGYDIAGYDRQGFDAAGYDTAGYNQDGFDIDGFDSAGNDLNGFDSLGNNVEDFDEAGYNKKGYDREGFDHQGYNKAGYDREGYNKDGFNPEEAAEYRQYERESTQGSGGGKNMLIGLLMVGVGVGITVGSYNSASNGGTYSVMYGLILMGIVTFCTGVYDAITS